MKNLKSFTSKLSLNKAKVVNLHTIHQTKGGTNPESGACAMAGGNPTNTFTILCGKDTIDTQ
ncbi:MAG: hypothetical protein AAF617_12420 [Bacteroidota bacterium]